MVAARKEGEDLSVGDGRPFYLSCALLAIPVDDEENSEKAVLASSKLDDRWREVDGAEAFLEGLSDKLVWIRSALPKMVKPKVIFVVQY